MGSLPNCTVVASTRSLVCCPVNNRCPWGWYKKASDPLPCGASNETTAFSGGHDERFLCVGYCGEDYQVKGTSCVLSSSDEEGGGTSPTVVALSCTVTALVVMVIIMVVLYLRKKKSSEVIGFRNQPEEGKSPRYTDEPTGEASRNVSDTVGGYSIPRPQNQGQNVEVEVNHEDNDNMNEVNVEEISFEEQTTEKSATEKLAAKNRKGSKDETLASLPRASSNESYDDTYENTKKQEDEEVNPLGAVGGKLKEELKDLKRNTKDGMLKPSQLKGGNKQTTQGGKSQTTRVHKSQTTQGGNTQTTQGGKSLTTRVRKSQTTRGGNTQTTRGGKSLTTRGGNTQTTRGGNTQTTQGGKSQSAKGQNSTNSHPIYVNATEDSEENIYLNVGV